MFDTYFSLLIRFRWLVILISFGLVGLIGLGTKNLYMETDYKVFFSEDNPQLLAFDNMQSEYTRSDNIVFIIAPDSGQIFSRETLSLVEELTKDSWTMSLNQRVDSLSNFQNTVADEDSMMVSPLVENPSELTDDELAEIKRIALNEEALYGKLIRDTADVTAVFVSFYLRDSSAQEYETVALEARALKAKYEEKYPEIKIMITGMLMSNYAMQEEIAKDTATRFPVMGAVILLALLFLLRSLFGMLATVVIIIFSTVCAMGVMGWLNIYMSGPSSVIPVIVITMAVADCVHILVSYYHNLSAGQEKVPALKESLRINIQPVFITSLTTAIGFLAMNFSDVPPFNHLGNIVSVGVIFAFIFSITFLPALMSLLPYSKKTKDWEATSITDWLASFVIQHQTRIFMITIVLGVIMVMLVPRNEINDEFSKFLGLDVPFRQATDFAEEHLTSLHTIIIELKSDSENGITDVEFLKKIEKLHEWLLTQPEVNQVDSIADMFKRLNRSMHGDDMNYFRLPENNQLASQYLLLYEMSIPFGLDLTNQINFDKTATLVRTSLDSLTTKQTLALDKRISDWIDENFPGLEHTSSGPSLMFSHIGMTNAKSMLAGTGLALVLISLILILMLRSLRYGLISLVPNLLPAVFAFGLWGLFIGNIGLSVAISIGMTLGIVVDSTVHFLSKYVRARREDNKYGEEAIRYAFSHVGVALIVTNVVLILGFLVISFSGMGVNSNMGKFTSMTFSLALTLDLLFLPALLLILDKRKENKLREKESG